MFIVSRSRSQRLLNCERMDRVRAETITFGVFFSAILLDPRCRLLKEPVHTWTQVYHFYYVLRITIILTAAVLCVM